MNLSLKKREINKTRFQVSDANELRVNCPCIP